jgi:hypothetical protein
MTLWMGSCVVYTGAYWSYIARLHGNGILKLFHQTSTIFEASEYPCSSSTLIKTNVPNDQRH